jgi:uncharacterized protein YgiM (DUF1202 family)
MKLEKKKLWLYGGSAAAFTLLIYFIFFNKKIDKKTNPPIPPKPPKPPVIDPEYPEYPDTDPEEEVDQVTTRSGTRLREKPTTDSKIIKTYSSGVKLRVIGSEEMLDGTWYEIASPRGYVRSDVVD